MEKNKNVSIEQVRLRTKLDVKKENDQFIGLIKCTADGNIGGQQGPGDLTTQENISKLEDASISEIKKQIKDALDVAQNKYESDVFGFGKLIHRRYPKEWKSIKKDWDKKFSDLPIEIEIVFNIRRTGLTTKPNDFY